MVLTLIIHSVVCVLGCIGGVMVATGSIMSIANMTVPWREWLLPAAMLVPAMFVLSAIGAWIAYSYSLLQLTIGLIALPWCYGVLFVLIMLVSFKWQETH